MNEYVCDRCYRTTKAIHYFIEGEPCAYCEWGSLRRKSPCAVSKKPVMPRKVYLVGSLRNPAIREAAKVLRDAGMEVFDDWHGCGPEADDHWKTYEKDRGRTYIQALGGKLAGHAFNFDKSNLDEADTVVLILPAGKSGHLELGYAAGRGKDTFIVLEPDRDEDRWDLMYKFATKVVTDIHGVPLYYAE